jgi:hypothetical protein
MKLIIGTLTAIAAAALLAACGSGTTPHSQHSAPSTRSPVAAATTQAAAADPCTAETTWRDNGGLASLRKVARALGNFADDETSADVAALQSDGTKLYAAALSAGASPPPIDRADYKKAMRLAEKATVDAQAGNYQAGTIAITETADLISAMNANLTSRCG